MRSYATSTFTIDAWEEQLIDDQEGTRITQTHITKTFDGDLVGGSVGDFFMLRAPEGSAAYVGLERITGRLLGRSGTFVLHHSATVSRGKQSGTWTVVPDSGTGELLALRGDAHIAADPAGTHTLELDYELE